MTRRTLYIAGFASWPAPTPARKPRKPCDHPRLKADGHCAGCHSLIYDRRGKTGPERAAV